jgi:hypothetical protein
MRLWSSPPSTMCRQHLLGEHVETHMMVASLNRGKNLDGFYSGLIDTRLIRPRHDALVAEMLRRGYQHRSPLPAFLDPQRGRLNGETPQTRCSKCLNRVSSST